MASMYEVIRAGHVLQLDNGQKVKLITKIGDGFTAVVFIAEPEDKTWRNENLVVKIAKPQAETNAYVQDEYQTLIDLSNRILRKGEPITPRVYGKGTIDNRFFIAMELLKGAPILGKDEIIKREEKDALEIFYHVFHFLEELHDLGITYPDLKLENFMWDTTLSEPSLRVLDFGAMGKTKNPLEDPQCFREIQRVSLGLFSSLTGRQLMVNASEDVIENIADVLERYELSYGTKFLLTRLLTRTKEFRLTEAKKVKEEIDGLIRFWTYDQETLFSKFQANYLRAESITISGDEEIAGRLFEEKLDCTKRAMAAINIYHLRFGKTEALFDDVTKKIVALEKASSYLTEARRLFSMREYSKATELLRKGEVLSQRPDVFHLWQYVYNDAITMPKEKTEALFDGVGQAIDSYEAGNFEAAQMLIMNLTDEFKGNKALEYVRNYIQFKVSLENCEQSQLLGEYEKALEEYKLAQRNFRLLPNYDYLEENYYKGFSGYLKLLADEAEKKKQENLIPKISFNYQTQLIEADNVQELLRIYQKILLFGEMSEESQLLLNAGIQQFLKKGRIENAFLLAELVNNLDNPVDKLVQTRNSVRLLVKCRYVVGRGDVVGSIELLERLVEQVKGSDFLTTSIKVLFNRVIKLDLLDLFDSEQNRLIKLATQIGDHNSKAHLERVFKEDLDRQLKKLSPTMKQIELDLLPTKEWYSELDRFIDDVQTMSLREMEVKLEDEDHWLDDIEKRIKHLRDFYILDKSILERLKRFEEEVNRRKSLISIQSNWLPSIRQELDERVNRTIVEWKNYKNSHSKNMPGELSRVGETTNIVYRTVKVMTEAARFTGNIEPFQEIAPDLLVEFDMLSIPIWDNLIPKKDEIPFDVKEVIRITRDFIQQGQLNLALEKLQRLEPVKQLYPEVLTLRMDLLKLKAYEKQIISHVEANRNRQYQYSQALIDIILEGLKVKGAGYVFKSLRVKNYLLSFAQQRRNSMFSQMKSLKSSIEKGKDLNKEASQGIFEYIFLKQAIKLVEDCEGINAR